MEKDIRAILTEAVADQAMVNRFINSLDADTLEHERQVVLAELPASQQRMLKTLDVTKSRTLKQAIYNRRN